MVRKSTRCGLLALLLPTIAIAVLLGPALIGRQRLAFRDVGHFYTPLYDYVSQRSSENPFPLWNPLDHTGVPIAGESTTALFYPLRIVFCVGLPIDAAMALYVATHLLLAAWGAAWAARVAGASSAGSAVAAVAYPLAGPVLFLYCNPPFLVGAAWLPIALAAALRCWEVGSRRSIAAAACALAMPVVAGDPQTPVHVLIVLALAIGSRAVRRSMHPQRAAASVGSPTLRSRLKRGALRLAMPASLAAGLAAPQVAASIDWARHSDRWFDRPPGVSRLLGADIDRGAAPSAAWWQSPRSGTHAADIYAFSVAPWHWIELLVPAAGGQLFPQFRRLSSLLPDDGRVWSLTLYAGLLPLLAWLARPRGHRWDVWDALVPVGLLLSLGSFGPVWLIQVLSGGDALADVHGPIGGPYWALVSGLPGYGSFRYPAKWLPMAALGLCIAAARTASQLNHRHRAALLRSTLAAAAVCGVVATATGPVAMRQWLLARLPAPLPADRFWGPLDADAALRMIAQSSLHVVVVAVLISLCLRVPAPRRWRRHWYRGRPWALAAVLTADLLIVGWPQIATVDRSLEAAVLRSSQPIAQPSAPDSRWLRTRTRGEGWPAAWLVSHSEWRIAEVEISQRRSLFARWHLARPVGVWNGSVSITPQRYRTFWQGAERATRGMTLQQRSRFWLAVSRWWGLEGYVLTGDDTALASGDWNIPLELVDVRSQPITATSPPVRWHRHWRSVAPQQRISAADWLARLNTVIDDPQAAVPLLETASDPAPAAVPKATSGDRGAGSVRVLQWDPETILLRTTATATGLVLLQQYQDGNWQCRYRRLPTDPWQTGAVAPADYLAMASVVPAGTHEVEFRYRPRWLVPSLLVMLGSAVCLLWLARAK